MSQVHLVMPMGGEGSRFQKFGYKMPKPLIPLNGKPFFYWATQSINKFISCKDITYVVLRDHVDNFNIYQEIKKYYPDANIKVIDEVLPGPLFTCLAGIDYITDDLPIIFNDCDHMFICNAFYSLINNDKYQDDGSLLTFESNEQRFSYVQYDKNKKIIGTVEKEVVSNHAICGAYIFRNVKIFRDMAEEYKEKCPYDEFFMSGLYNIMCNNEKVINDYLLDFHVDYGTPVDYEDAKNSNLFNKLK